MIDGNARSAGVAGVNYPASSQEQQSGGLGGGYFFWPVLLGLIWTFMVIVVNPLGNFPLNDDWAYGYSVRALVENAQIRFSDWTATNLFGQVLWGALFCLPFGFSFTALRFSTAVLGFVGVLATYGILRELKTSRATAAIGALTLAFCPIYFALSLTFMNDVPFAAFAISSLYFFLRGLRLDSSLTIAVGLVLAGVAILTRQLQTCPSDSLRRCVARKKGSPCPLFVVGVVCCSNWSCHPGCLPDLVIQTWSCAGQVQRSGF